MKKIYILISVFALAVLALGCSKEVDVQDDLQSEAVNDGLEETITVMLSVPETPETKTTLGAKDGSSYPVLWSAGDVITLNGTAASEFTPASGNATATAKFKVTNLAAPYNFLYRGVSGQSNQVTFPANQAYVANGFDPTAMPMYASLAARTDNVTFSHVASLLRFSITGEKKIDSVTLTAVDGTQSLSGTFTIGAGSNGVLNGSLTPASSGGEINYNFGGHIQLSDTPFVFYVAVPAGTYAGGINLVIVDNDSGHMNVAVLDGSSNTLAAGKVIEFDNITYIPAKENNLKQIWNATTFQEFVTAVAGGNKTLNARLTPSAASIDLSSVASSFASIEGYKGTFDGNGKTLSGLTKPMFDDLQGVVKNLTLNSTIAATAADGYHWGIFANQIIPSLEVDDVPGLQNCTANGSITWTPASAVNSMMTLGGLVGNNKGGTITGCTNNAAVTFANNGVSNGNQPSIGGVVGRTQKGGDLKTQGEISSCTNNGTVICAAEFSQNIYIGGVLGYQVEKAETMSGCVNHGLVKVASTASTGAALHLGGVAGLAKGTVENCTNASDGVVTAEACSVTTYVCQGGVVGRLNREADSYSGLSNAGTLNAAAADPSSGSYIGGVVGRCNEGAAISDFTNSGSINYTGSSEHQVFIGGVVATNTQHTLSSCFTTGGTISYNGETTAGNMYIGGIVGYATKEIANCTNAMSVNVGGAFAGTGGKYYSVGGIVGSMSENAPISSCLNTGNVTYSQEISNSAYSFLGGVAGRAMGNITDSSNGGTVTWSGMNSSQNPFIGGLVGDTANNVDVTISGKYGSASATNYGNVVLNTSTQTNKYFYVGGVVGRARATVTATNAGQINIAQLKCSRLYLGGVVGTNSREMGSGNANLAAGDINVSGLNVNSDYLYLGGITGLNSAAVTSATNAGDIVTTSGSTCKKTLFVGGIVGRGEANISSCTNSGLVSNGCPQASDGSYTQVGGIVGYNNGSSALSNCVNSGNVTNSGTSKGCIYVGGITSETDAAITSCHNTGAVSNSGEALTQKTDTKVYQINVGGVAGHNGGATITSCYNTGAVSNTADSGAGIMLGGITGEAAGGTYITCYNTGAISNTGFAYDSAERADAALGGLVGFLNGDVIMTGTSAAYNYNNGPISETSTTAYVALSGIAGIIKGNCELSFVKNLADGDLTCAENTRKKVYVGGCVGIVQRLFTMNDASNAGDLNFSNLTIYNNSSSNVQAGGVIGAFSDSAGDVVDPSASDPETIQDAEFTFYRLTNSGAISCPNSGGNGGNMAAAGKSSTAYSYFGGISGVGNTFSKNFYNCTNTGNITVYNQVKTRLGGILGYTNHNPTGCVCNVSDKILYYRYNPKSNGGKGEIGGVVGYFNSDEFEDLTFIGGLQTTGSSPNCFTGGLIGRTKQAGTFLNCKVGKNGKNIVGARSGKFAKDEVSEADHMTGGLFVSADGSYAFDFNGSIVATGTKCQGTTITASNINDALVGREVPTSITNPPTIGSW
jgi:hypothetical protein